MSKEWTSPGLISTLLNALPEEILSGELKPPGRYMGMDLAASGAPDQTWAVVGQYMSEVVRYETLRDCDKGKCAIRETYREQQQNKPFTWLWCYCDSCDRVGYLTIEKGEAPCQILPDLSHLK